PPPVITATRCASLPSAMVSSGKDSFDSIESERIAPIERVTLGAVPARGQAARELIPLHVWTRQSHHWPVSAIDQAIRAELLDQVLRIRPQIVLAPVGRRCLGEQPR